MKCLNHSFMVCWLVLLLVVFSGIASAETTSEKYEKITTELQELSNKFNEVSVNSELTLMDLQEISLQLQQELKAVQKELDLAMNDLAKVMVLSENNLLKWNNLQTGINSLSSSVETLVTDFTTLGKSIKRAEIKSDIGLGLSITAVVIAIATAVYNMFKKGQ